MVQAKKLHPDANLGNDFRLIFNFSRMFKRDNQKDDPNAQSNFQKLQDAYNVLKDEQTRWEYDRTIEPEKKKNTTR